MRGIQGKVFTVTGAASGIGQATTVRLAQLGATGIAISDVDVVGLEKTKKLCEAHETKITTRKVDVRVVEDVNRWIEDTYTEFGKLDGAANVAGVAGGDGDTTVETVVQKDWEFTMGVNVNGVMHCMRAQLAKLTKPGGSIVNVSSTSGLHGLPHSAAYSTSKFAVIGLTESAAGEFGKAGVRINAILPGPTDTKIFRDGEEKGLFSADAMGGSTLLGRMGSAEEIANVLCFMLSYEASFVTGASWVVDGGYNAGRSAS
ncbi:3-oxoacyl-[acyl-carrier-protein] reductase [Lachnellula willkommii]|uniref:3-oxoacyl-[acyl-carrier-protein] reductase n=1 Tax=Lachnellula willkommii TaxID=215461 RepID=A0A559LZ35_9HELO|nr:3-oxoacyl-[acyl-carrier-protein] reductase [Lachnellula willkommii]